MWWLIPSVLTALGLGFLVKKKDEETTGIDVETDTVAIKKWEPITIAIAVPAKIPWQYAQAWIAIESSGNPCAIGEKNKYGPDGNPKEMGLFQLYNPDDLKSLKATGDELRAYCIPGTQKLSRVMTSVEIRRHVELGIGLILKCKRRADQFLTANKVNWSPSGRDYWRFVKLYHALPAIVSPGLSDVCKALGYPPRTWSEFRAAYEKLNPRARFNPNVEKQDGYYRALDNAQWTGGAVPEDFVYV